MRWRSCYGMREWMCGNRWYWRKFNVKTKSSKSSQKQGDRSVRPTQTSLGRVEFRCNGTTGEGCGARQDKKQGVLTENLWPKLLSEAPRCAPLRLFSLVQAACHL